MTVVYIKVSIEEFNSKDIFAVNDPDRESIVYIFNNFVYSKVYYTNEDILVHISNYVITEEEYLEHYEENIMPIPGEE